METLETAISENEAELRCKGWCRDVPIYMAYSEKLLVEQKYFN